MDPWSPSTQAWSSYVRENGGGEGHRAWWFARDADPPTGYKGGFEGLEESLEFIGALTRDKGPVDAIWGFSQGACFAGMLCALLSPHNKTHPFRAYIPENQGPVRAGVFFSGFKARFEQYESLYAPGVQVPTLHIMGLKDEAVSMERSEGLVEVCGESAKMVRHKGGHDIPKGREEVERIVRRIGENLGVGEGARERESL